MQSVFGKYDIYAKKEGVCTIAVISYHWKFFSVIKLIDGRQDFWTNCRARNKLCV